MSKELDGIESIITGDVMQRVFAALVEESLHRISIGNPPKILLQGHGDIRMTAKVITEHVLAGMAAQLRASKTVTASLASSKVGRGLINMAIKKYKAIDAATKK